MIQIIFDKDRWNQAKETERQEVVNFLMENRLKGKFEFLGFKEFSCQDQKNTIAIFHHIDTNMNFH